MKISSRGELIELIEKKAIKTELVKKDKNKTMFYTVIYNKRNDEFYRITWGHISQEHGQDIVYCNENIENVKLHPETGKFLTKEEIIYEDQYAKDDLIPQKISEFVKDKSDEKHLIFKGGLKNKFKTFYSNDLAKEHLISKTSKNFLKGKSLLYVSNYDSDFELEELQKSFEKAVVEGKDKAKYPKDVKSHSMFISLINHGDPGFTIKNAILEYLNEEGKNIDLDLVVIDYLVLEENTEDAEKRILEEHRVLNEMREYLGFKIIIRTVYKKTDI